MQEMSSNRPYLLRAFYEWILDNECTPYLVVEADMPHVNVPPQTIKDGQVVLNISPNAVHALQIDEQQLTFSARFGGVPFEVYLPMYAISAIYARENGAGTMFPPEEYEELDDTEETKPSMSAVDTPKANVEEPSPVENKLQESPKPKSKGSHLSIVK